MLLKRPVLDAIARGDISLVFRRWRKPTVKAGGTLRTAIGMLAIEAVDVVDDAAVTDADAALAGYSSVADLRCELAQRTEGAVYRIRVSPAGADPRIQLRNDDALPAEQLADLRTRLARLDRQAPWTARALDLIAENPGRRAGDLAPPFGLETAVFKQNVRKLKALGLTESLEVGYRLSPRGAALVASQKAMIA